jgi:hypothetical protein
LSQYGQYEDSNEISHTRRLIFLYELISLSKSADVYYELYNEIYDGLTQQEIDQVNRSRKQIAEGKSKKFSAAEEYLISLDSEKQ